MYTYRLQQGTFYTSCQKNIGIHELLVNEKLGNLRTHW